MKKIYKTNDALAYWLIAAYFAAAGAIAYIVA